MDNTTITSTGNPIVDAVGSLELTGNLIPEYWYYTIANHKCKPNMNAIMILADIVYWYRPTKVIDEINNKVTYKTKFKDKDFIQKSYQDFMHKFNLSRDQVHSALIFLEELGVIKRHFRNIPSSVGLLSNVMFIELRPLELTQLTYPLGKPKPKEKENTSIENSKEVIEISQAGLGKNPKTYTKTTTNNSTETTTTSLGDDISPPVVDEAKEVFSSLGLSDQDIISIVRAASNDIDKCKTALTVLNQQTKEISNIAGWLIKAVENNYQPISKRPDIKKNSFNNFHQREYDYDELENILLSCPLP